MIRNYESGSGLKGALSSLIGECVMGALCADNTITIFFETGSAVSIRAENHGLVAMCPLNADDTSAYIKRLVRATDQRQADLSVAIQILADQSCANKPKTRYVNAEECGTTRGALCSI